MSTASHPLTEEWQAKPSDENAPRMSWIPWIWVITLLLTVGTMVFLWFQEKKGIAAGKVALKNAYQIHVALTVYARSNQGVFPIETETGETPTYSNDLLRLLFVKDLVDDETLFHVNGHAIHAGGKPDGNIGTPENGYKEALGPGENAFEYVPGLTFDRHEANLPMLRTVFPDGQEVVVTLGGGSKVYKPLSEPQKWLSPTPGGHK
jgi:hypothetical protein